MDRNRVPPAKSFTFASRSAPAGNTRLSSAWGAASPAQLTAFDHRAVAPPPSHTRVANTIRSSSDSNPSAGLGAASRPFSAPPRDARFCCRVWDSRALRSQFLKENIGADLGEKAGRRGRARWTRKNENEPLGGRARKRKHRTRVRCWG